MKEIIIRDAADDAEAHKKALRTPLIMTRFMVCSLRKSPDKSFILKDVFGGESMPVVTFAANSFCM
jgi:hypothetical protein